MNCEQVRPWLGALLDGELDARNSGEIEAHLTNCPSCHTIYRADVAVRTNLRRAGMRFELPGSLRDRVMSEFAAPAEAASLSYGRRTKSYAPAFRLLRWSGWALALAMSALFALNLQDRRADVRDELIALHVRSMLADHLSDVTSSDRHTVKPWFAGRLDFAPAVPDLASHGFPLVGGRLDYLDGGKVAALVYRRRAHVINVVVRPSDRSREWGALPFNVPQRTLNHRGYSLRTWRASGLSFVAVSDLNPTELESFERVFNGEAARSRP